MAVAVQQGAGLAPVPVHPASPSGQSARLGFERVELLLATANNLMAEARLVEADALFREILALYPDDLRGLLGLARGTEHAVALRHQRGVQVVADEASGAGEQNELGGFGVHHMHYLTAAQRRVNICPDKY